MSAVRPTPFTSRYAPPSPQTVKVSVRISASVRARELLEGARAAPVEEIAKLCGFGSAATLRHHFRRRFGLGPAAYRTRFAGG